MKIKFRDIRMGRDNKTRLDVVNTIVEEYQQQGYKLTLRQLYYQLVSRDIIPNKITEYNKISILLKEGRMAGIVDWNAIEDRLRRPSKPGSWDSPADIVDTCIRQFALDHQMGQDVYLEVWVEKDALSGVLSRVTNKYHVPIVVNRGYSSATAMYDAHVRFTNACVDEGKPAKVIYVGDFDPSGQDMIRDIIDRIEEFNAGNPYGERVYDFDIVPIALTWGQIRTYNPPPNPAKITDPRAKEYIARHGDSSWEVDALKPEVLHSLLENTIQSYIDMDQYQSVLDEENKCKEKLKALKQHLL